MTHPASTRDPLRFIEVILADPSHTLPLPDRGGRLFAAGGETIDAHHPFYAALVADGSLRPKPPPVSPEVPQPATDIEPLPAPAAQPDHGQP